MAMKKYTSPAEVKVFTGVEAEVVNKHLSKNAKAVSDFNEDELSDLQSDLEGAREQEEKLKRLTKRAESEDAK
jgi:hypothetical protein